MGYVVILSDFKKLWAATTNYEGQYDQSVIPNLLIEDNNHVLINDVFIEEIEGDSKHVKIITPRGQQHASCMLEKTMALKSYKAHTQPHARCVRVGHVSDTDMCPIRARYGSGHVQLKLPGFGLGHGSDTGWVRLERGWAKPEDPTRLQ